MSGVSITSGNVDMDAVLSGGQAFVDRLAQLKSSIDGARQAQADLALAKDARSAMDEAARQLDQAKQDAETIRARALADATTAQKSLNDWAAATRDAAAQALMRAEGKERDADQKLAAAQTALADANSKLADADAKLAKATKAAEAVTAAQAALSAAI
jgi:hypothetical protein